MKALTLLLLLATLAPAQERRMEVDEDVTPQRTDPAASPPTPSASSASRCWNPPSLRRAASKIPPLAR